MVQELLIKTKSNKSLKRMMTSSIWCFKRPLWMNKYVDKNREMTVDLRTWRLTTLLLNKWAVRIWKRSWAFSLKSWSTTWWLSKRIMIKSGSSGCPLTSSRVFYSMKLASGTFLRFLLCISLPRPISASFLRSFRVRVRWRNWPAFTKFWLFYGSRMTI